MSDSDRFAGIPENAVRKNTTHVRVNVYDNPFMDATTGVDPFRFGDEEMHAWYEGPGGEFRDTTEEYNKWCETQPQIKRVTFEWTENDG